MYIYMLEITIRQVSVIGTILWNYLKASRAWEAQITCLFLFSSYGNSTYIILCMISNGRTFFLFLLGYHE